MLTLTQVVKEWGNIVNAVDIPVLVEGEDGYGGFANVQRTLRQMGMAGIAGHLNTKDQGYPVICGAICK